MHRSIDERMDSPSEYGAERNKVCFYEYSILIELHGDIVARSGQLIKHTCNNDKSSRPAVK